MVGTDNDELAEQGYVPYLTNKALSYFPDTIFYSNQINTREHLDKKLQYDYFLNSIKAKRRFSKWIKNEDDDDLELVKIYFNYSTKKAEQVLSVLSSGDIKTIRNKVYGGVGNNAVGDS